MTARARFKQEDLTRAIRGAAKANMRIGRIEITTDGKIVILSESAVPPAGRNPWDEDL